MVVRSLLGLVVIVLMSHSPANAGSVTVDEFGNGFGTTSLGFRAFDPGPSIPVIGPLNALTYNLPFAGVQGDVVLTETFPFVGAVRTDLIRFNGDGTLIFYSDAVPFLDPADSLADTVALLLIPTYTNKVTLAEVGTGAANGAFYTPTVGQPGYDAVAKPTYHFVSDGVAVPATAVPEPATLISASIAGLVGLGCVLRRRQRTA